MLLQFSKIVDPEGQSIRNRWMQNGVAIVQALFGSSFDEHALHGQRPSKSSSLLVAILSIMGFTLFVCYTSIFTSSLANKELKIPFKSLSELTQHSSFKLRAYCGGSTTGALNRIIANDSKLENVYEKYVIPNCRPPGESTVDDKKWFVENKESKDIGILNEIGTIQTMLEDHPEGFYYELS